jgi:hypothetical protein
MKFIFNFIFIFNFNHFRYIIALSFLSNKICDFVLQNDFVRNISTINQTPPRPFLQRITMNNNSYNVTDNSTAMYKYLRPYTTAELKPMIFWSAVCCDDHRATQPGATVLYRHFRAKAVHRLTWSTISPIKVDDFAYMVVYDIANNNLVDDFAYASRWVFQ